MSSPNPSAPDVSALPNSPAPVVNPAKDSRLDQLTAEYALLKPQEKATAERLKHLTTAMKTELANLHPGAPEILLTSPHLTAPLQLQAVSSWRLDSTALKREHPTVWVEFAKQSTSWRLAPVAG